MKSSTSPGCSGGTTPARRSGSGGRWSAARKPPLRPCRTKPSVCDDCADGAGGDAGRWARDNGPGLAWHRGRARDARAHRAELDGAVGLIHRHKGRPRSEQSERLLLLQQVLHPEEGVVLVPGEVGARRVAQLAPAVEARGHHRRPARQSLDQPAECLAAEEVVLEGDAAFDLVDPAARRAVRARDVRLRDAGLEGQALAGAGDLARGSRRSEVAIDGRLELPRGGGYRRRWEQLPADGEALRAELAPDALDVSRA